MPRLVFLMLFLSFSITSYSQFRFSEAEIIFQSRHVWRGDKLGTAPAIEPSVTFSGGRFSFNVWAAVTTNNSYSEVDLIPSYQFKELSVTLLDYYNPVAGKSNSYLNFQDSLNRHSVELTVDNYSVENRRLKWMIGTFLLGDQNKETGNPYFSTYLEVKYPFTVFTIETEPFIGLTPFPGYYADRFAIINTGLSFSKEIDLKLPFTIPLKLSFISNPYTKQSFVIFAGGIAF
jgi:hypothetical protein